MTAAIPVMIVIVLGLFAVAALSIIMLTWTVRSLLRMMAARAVDRVVQAGERQVRDGVVHVATSVAADMKKRDPKRIEPEVAQLAEKRQGKLTVVDIVAALEVPSLTAQECLASMVRKKLCRPKSDSSGTVYLFDNYLPTREVRLCPFCETEFPNDDSPNCPNCGGAITVKQVKLD